MTFPVEDFGIEQAAIPVCQQSEANVALAVPELPRYKLQHVLGGRKVQEAVEVLLSLELIENLGVQSLALGRALILERERCATVVESDRHDCVVDLSIADTHGQVP